MSCCCSVSFLACGSVRSRSSGGKFISFPLALNELRRGIGFSLIFLKLRHPKHHQIKFHYSSVSLALSASVSSIYFIRKYPKSVQSCLSQQSHRILAMWESG